MRTEYGAVFIDRASRRSTETADADTERDPIADWQAGFRQRARGEEPREDEGEPE